MHDGDIFLYSSTVESAPGSCFGVAACVVVRDTRIERGHALFFSSRFKWACKTGLRIALSSRSSIPPLRVAASRSPSVLAVYK